MHFDRTPLVNRRNDPVLTHPNKANVLSKRNYLADLLTNVSQIATYVPAFPAKLL